MDHSAFDFTIVATIIFGVFVILGVAVWLRDAYHQLDWLEKDEDD